MKNSGKRYRRASYARPKLAPEAEAKIEANHSRAVEECQAMVRAIAALEGVATEVDRERLLIQFRNTIDATMADIATRALEGRAALDKAMTKTANELRTSRADAWVEIARTAAAEFPDITTARGMVNHQPFRDRFTAACLAAFGEDYAIPSDERLRKALS